MLSHEEEVTITTFDYPIQCKNNNLVLEYYSVSVVDGENQYSYKLTIPNYVKKSNDYVFLMGFQTGRGDDVLIYLEKAPQNKRSLITILNPRDNLTAMVHPGGLLEVVFIDPSNILALPSIDNSLTAFDVEFIRREVIDEKDEVFRPYRRLFDIKRWSSNYCQTHFFFRVSPKNYEMFMRSSWNGYMFGPTISFINSGEKVNLKIKIHVDDRVREELMQIPKEDAVRVSNEGVVYGTEAGTFCGTQIMSQNVNSIVVDRDSGFQEIEVLFPDFDCNKWPNSQFTCKMGKIDCSVYGGQAICNGWRVVNRVLLLKFLVINNTIGCSNDTPIGKAEFSYKETHLSWPVYLGQLDYSAMKKSIRCLDRLSKPLETLNYLVPKKIRVAKEVKFIKIENNNKLFDEVVKPVGRLVEDPTDEETVCMYGDELLNIRLTNQVLGWRLTSWPSFLCSEDSRCSANYSEFKFKVSRHNFLLNKKSKIIFECGKIERKIFIKIID